mmetsp:Transcript_92462/g.298865  ORF Transcript_92462/g.298865 Transcript_92462/m.298865 type:complete len:274 (+) Transcript_92462:856-1677(+)
MGSSSGTRGRRSRRPALGDRRRCERGHTCLPQEAQGHFPDHGRDLRPHLLSAPSRGALQGLRRLDGRRPRGPALDGALVGLQRGYRRGIRPLPGCEIRSPQRRARDCRWRGVQCPGRRQGLLPRRLGGGSRAAAREDLRFPGRGRLSERRAHKAPEGAGPGLAGGRLGAGDRRRRSCGRWLCGGPHAVPCAVCEGGSEVLGLEKLGRRAPFVGVGRPAPGAPAGPDPSCAGRSRRRWTTAGPAPGPAVDDQFLVQPVVIARWLDTRARTSGGG